MQCTEKAAVGSDGWDGDGVIEGSGVKLAVDFSLLTDQPLKKRRLDLPITLSTTGEDNPRTGLPSH